MSQRDQSNLAALFETDGFVLLPDLITANEVSRVQESLLQTAEQFRFDKAFESHSISQVDDLLKYDQCVADLICKDEILDLVNRILGKNPRLTFSALVINEPSKKRGNMHSDWPYNQNTACHFEPPYDYHPAAHINVMLMVSDFNQENGGTAIIPRSHKRPTNPTCKCCSQNQFGEFEDEISVFGKAGSVAFFDCRLWHRSPANTSSDSRRVAVIFRFAAWWLNLETLNPHSKTRELWTNNNSKFENYINRLSETEFQTLPQKLKPLAQHLVEENRSTYHHKLVAR